MQVWQKVKGSSFVILFSTYASIGLMSHEAHTCINTRLLATRWYDNRPKSNLVVIVSPTVTVPSFPMYFTVFSAYQILPIFGWVCFNFIPVESHPAANSDFVAGGTFVG